MDVMKTTDSSLLYSFVRKEASVMEAICSFKFKLIRLAKEVIFAIQYSRIYCIAA